MQNTSLIDVREILFNSTSDALKQKHNQAFRILSAAANREHQNDPKEVSLTTSQFTVTELYNFAGIEDARLTEKIKGEDAVYGLIAGMRWVYHRDGHTEP